MRFFNKMIKIILYAILHITVFFQSLLLGLTFASPTMCIYMLTLALMKESMSVELLRFSVLIWMAIGFLFSVVFFIYITYRTRKNLR